jgi:geranylgeranyl diphosphate synthase type I
MAHWTQDVVTRVNARLEAFFAEKLTLAEQTSPAAPELVEAVAELTMRGGKRLRPAALFAGYRAASPEGDVALTLDASASLELLQSYLLIQDDWMDRDEERRGGPTVHVALGRKHGDMELGARLAILAGDLASGFAWELVHGAPFPPARRAEGLAAFTEMHFEVVSGQQLDLIGHPDVARMHDLKSGSYTVRGPLALGGLLGNASAQQLDVLSRFALPIGVAFQLRDDLLGSFGDPAQTGKSAGNDLRVGKLTSLVAEARARLEAKDREPLERVLRGEAGDQASVDAARSLLEGCGAKNHVEQRLVTLLEQARSALKNAPLSVAGVEMLFELSDKLGSRNH